MSENFILEMRNISKEFPGVRALDDVQLRVRKGTVHILMGENGAGKSTLMKVLTGNYMPEKGGQIIFDGEELDLKNPREAIEKGISMIHQELSPLKDSSIADNIFLGNYPMKHGMIDYKTMYSESKEVLKMVNEDYLSPAQKMSALSIAQMQLVEIGKALHRNAKLVIMDEATSALTNDEADRLFELINELKNKGVTFIYITHRMDEVFKIGDYVTVFRDGKYIDELNAKETTIDEIIRLMIGRELTRMFPPATRVKTDDVILETKDLALEGVFNGVNIKVHKGEVVGFAGLIGAGRTEVVETIFGVRRKTGGEVYVNGARVEITSPGDGIRSHMGLVTEDRQHSGLFQPLSVRDNASIVALWKFIKGGLIRYKPMESECERQVAALNIKTPNTMTRIYSLSGGNQQKVILSRWLMNDPDILLLDEPTRGIDVGAKYEIYKLVDALAAQGKAVVFVSSELEEILGVCDRIYVMHEGKITGEVAREDASQELLMNYATNKYGQPNHAVS